jgi:hypothetical protein
MSAIPFRFDFELEAFEKAGSPPGKERRIGGYVTTDQLDRQGEKLIQSGINFDPFIKGGWFNDNHSQATEDIVGYPETAEIRHRPDGSKGWYVEGYMLKGDGNTKADKLWGLAKSLQKSDRRLGYSVEGGIMKRDASDPNTVLEAVVQNVAITSCPINTNTAMDILAKSLSAGHAIGNPGSSPGEGFALRTESLEGPPAINIEAEEEKKRKKKLSKAQAIQYLQGMEPELSDQQATLIVDYAIRHHSAA